MNNDFTMGNITSIPIGVDFLDIADHISSLFKYDFSFPLLDAFENDDEFVIFAETTGTEKDDIKIELENNILTISGEKKDLFIDNKKFKTLISERKFGEFERKIKLPKEVDSTKIKAETKNGVLKISIPKTESVKAKKIEIEIN